MFHSTLLFLNIGTPELLLILGAALLLFGGEKLPELAKGLGKGIREFKDASEEVKREITNQINNFEEKKPVETVTPAEPESETVAALPAATHVPNTMPVSDSYTATDQHHEEHTPEATEPAETAAAVHEHHEPTVSANGAETAYHSETSSKHQPDQF